VGDRVGKGLRSSARDALIAESVDPSIRGRAFGVHSAADNAGAVLGPLVAFAALTWFHAGLRTVFWLAAVPGLIAVVVVIVAVRDVPQRSEHGSSVAAAAPNLTQPMGGLFWRVLVTIFVFTLGNSTDAFLLLRATQLGVPVALAPILWAVLNLVKSASNVPGGALSDRVGRRPILIAGWVYYAVIYMLFAFARSEWQAWMLFAAYGVYFGLVEGAERALVADIVPPSRRGAAYGWYNLAIGIGALPASIMFGVLWDKLGSRTAFLFGATLAVVAAVGLAVLGRGDGARGR